MPQERAALGLQITAAVVALVCGGLLGALFTVAHRATVGDFPIGLVLGVIAVAALLTGIRLLWPIRLPAIGAAVGIVGAIAWLSTVSPGGSVLVTAGVVGIVWMIAPVVVAAIVIAWPAPRPRPAEPEQPGLPGPLG